MDPEEPELEEGEEKEYPSDVYEINSKIFPASCIVLEGNDLELITRVRDLPEKDIVGTHYTATDMERRLEAYRLANNSKVAEPSV